MSRANPADRWTATHAHLRAVLVPLAGLVGALLLGRPDLVVLVAPLVVVLVWTVLARPGRAPQHRHGVSRGVLREGDRAGLAVEVERVRHTELVATSLAATPWVRLHPRHGARVVLVHGQMSTDRQPVQVVTGFVPQRWGHREVGPGLVGATGAWAGYRWGPVPLAEVSVRTLPQPHAFDTRAPAPHPRGVVGTHRSVRPGEGTEFASIRAFQWGDRLRRIHWPRSLRAGSLHVTTTFAEQDTRVEVLVDAHHDLGSSGGLTGAPSSLDHTVRAAAAITEHFLHQGDRVGTQVLSARTPHRVPVGTGRRHGRRILETLATIVPGPQERIDPRRVARGLPGSALVVLVSALVSPDVLGCAAVLARRGLSVVVVDALVADVPAPSGDDALGRLAWRLRLLERDRELRRLEAQGVPVVPWHGPGSLDLVLTSLTRRRRHA